MKETCHREPHNEVSKRFLIFYKVMSKLEKVYRYHVAYWTKAKSTGKDKRVPVKCLLFVLVGVSLLKFEWHECSGVIVMTVVYL